MSSTGVCLRPSLVERFWEKVNVRGPDECWEWIGTKQSKGYGMTWDGEKPVLAHRISWELHNGPIPEGFCVLHHCDKRACVNPAHLFLGTNADNSADMVNKNRQARGKRQGHAKLTQRKVREIRALIAYGLSTQVIGRKYGVTRNAIYKIKTGKNWSWLS